MAPTPIRAALSAAILLSLTLASCSTATDEATSATGAGDGCIEDFDPTADYFPDKVEIEDAENFDITYHGSYQVLTVDEPFPGAQPESYVLVRCGAPAPELEDDLASAQQITVPVASAYSSSSTHLPMFVEIDRADTVTGVAGADFVSSPEIRERIDAGEVVDFSPAGTINDEVVVVENPEVFITGGTDAPAHRTLRDAGVPVVANAEWLEPTPLGRAEWIKMIGALTGAEAAATETYSGIRERYNEVAESVASVEPVEILPGNMSQGTWFMPTGGTYVGRLIADAGGTYPWLDAPGNKSVELNFETVYARAGQIPLWFVVNTNWATVADIVADTPQYGELTAVREGAVWNASKAIGPSGGNDYWERGVARPDLILADLAAIIHPDTAPGHEFTFYQQLDR